MVWEKIFAFLFVIWCIWALLIGPIFYMALPLLKMSFSFTKVVLEILLCLAQKILKLASKKKQIKPSQPIVRTPVQLSNNNIFLN